MVTAVVGLDLSLTATGIATPDGVRTITSKGKTGASLGQRADRLVGLARAVVDAVVDARFPDDDDAHEQVCVDMLVVLEAPAFDSRTGHQHDRSGLWWLVVDELHAMTGIDLVEVTTGGLKKYATGRGNAGKDEVLAAVVRRYPDVLVGNNNEADALVLRAMGCDRLGQPLAALPQVHRAALNKVAWPVGLGLSLPRTNTENGTTAVAT